MKRRHFLGLFSSAVTAPLIPVPAMAQAGYSQAAWNTAVATARSSAAVSVNGMASLLKISPAASEALMRDMISKGMLGPLSAPRHGGTWAVSRIMKSGNIAALHKAHQVAQKQAPSHDTDVAEPDGELPGWIVHLHKVCRENGLNLHERCFA